jgi:hypothetical protein
MQWIMASPEPPEEETLGAAADRQAPLPLQPVSLPVYRPRRRVGVVFWVAFALAAVLVAVLLILTA